MNTEDLNIEKYEVVPIEHVWRCECGGEFQFTGDQGISNPPVNEHKCTGCGEYKSLRGITYPKIEYERRIDE